MTASVEDHSIEIHSIIANRGFLNITPFAVLELFALFATFIAYCHQYSLESHLYMTESNNLLSEQLV